MNMRALVLVLSTSFASVAIAKAPPSTPTVAPKVEKFGGELKSTDAVPLAKVVADPDAYAGKTVVVDGAVRAACTRKGCWMELAPTAAKGSQGCRVTFKDYGFFVPTNSAGATARVEGVVGVRKLAKAEVDHYESEGATFSKKDPDGGAREVAIVATGVELKR